MAARRSIGHIAIAVMLGYLDFRFPDDGWRRRRPRLAAWYATLPRIAACARAVQHHALEASPVNLIRREAGKTVLLGRARP
jgi:hypothetical protein